ncbi:MAG: hypothetical protein FJW53_06355 [Actinobacteria bacterium]|nr:hypothetical protein [Actinomycetota bacterium]
MVVEPPAPEDLETLLNNIADEEAGATARSQRSEQVRSEGLVAAKYWGAIQYRIIVTFVVFSVCWTGVLVVGLRGAIPLWLGLVLNSVLASTFYMPMHEAAHKNIMGKSTKGRWLEEMIGRLTSIPTGLEFTSHRASHMWNELSADLVGRGARTEGRARGAISPVVW